MANSNVAFLNGANIPLGTQAEDGLRVGPTLDRTSVDATGAISTIYPYNQWGLGSLLSSKNTYNIIPRGPSSAGNIVASGQITAASWLTLAGDDYIATQFPNPDYPNYNAQNGPNNGPTYLQLDWPRALSVIVAANAEAAANITVFGLDYYGVPLQEAVLNVQNAGTYQMKKAFYVITGIYCNGILNQNVSIQTTDVLGLPYRIKSVGDIDSIRWGNSSDMSTSSPIVSNIATTGVATLTSTGTTTVNTTAVTKHSNIQVTRATVTGTEGNISVPTASITDNTSFGIHTDGAETSTVNWLITNPTFASGTSAAMTNGVVVIPTTAVQANSVIQLQMGTFGTATGAWRVSSIIPGVSFTVTSSENTETSTVVWEIIPQDWVSGVSSNLVATAGGSVVTVSAPSVLNNSVILVTYNTLGGTTGVLSVPSASIEPGVGFVIKSSSATDTSTVTWTIVQNIPSLTQGTATLAAGTVTVNTTAVQSSTAANNVIILTYNTFGGTLGTYTRVSAVTANTSFVITSQNNADTSTVDWAIFPINNILPVFTTPLGTFTPADDTPATNTTGDVRGTYKPSTPANGYNVLHFSAFISGFDNFVNQQAAALLPAGGTSTTPLTRGSIGIEDQMGVAQYYTGTVA